LAYNPYRKAAALKQSFADSDQAWLPSYLSIQLLNPDISLNLVCAEVQPGDSLHRFIMLTATLVKPPDILPAINMTAGGRQVRDTISH
jgi:hypothetical protein